MTVAGFLLSLAERFEGQTVDGVIVGESCLRTVAEMARDCRDYATIANLEAAELRRMAESLESAGLPRMAERFKEIAFSLSWDDFQPIAD